jgi:hypothetical protein
VGKKPNGKCQFTALRTRGSNPSWHLSLMIKSMTCNHASCALVLLIAAITLSLLSGCAHVSIYSDEELKHRSSFKFYNDVQPYLLVAYGKDGSATASVFYLKDPKSAKFLVPHQGWGTAQMSLSLSNGVLSAYGMQTDSKGPETITALSSLATSAANIAKLALQSGVSYSDQGTAIYQAVNHFNDSVAGLPVPAGLGAKVADLGSSLKKIADAISDKSYTGVDNSKYLNLLDGHIKTLGDWITATKTTAPAYATALTALQKSIQSVATAFKSGGSGGGTASFELYQIIQLSDGTTQLKRIPH